MTAKKTEVTEKGPRKKNFGAKKSNAVKKSSTKKSTTVKKASTSEAENKTPLMKQRRYDGTFNIFAFIFSSLYFGYKNLGGCFILFLFLPFLLYMVFGLFINEGAALLCGWLTTHIIAGFTANPICRRDEAKYEKKYGRIDTSKPAEYFAIPLWRLVIFTILSGGLYEMYWGYRNWKSYQKATNDDVSPASNAFFFNLTVIPLFSKMSATLKSKKVFLLCGVGCFLLFLIDRSVSLSLSKGWIGYDWRTICLVVLLVSAIIYPLCLIPVQKKVNEYTVNTLKKTLDKRFYPWELVIFVIGMLINYVFWFGNPFSSQANLSDEQMNKLAQSVGFVYTHTKGYPAVCAKEGYEMKQYPAVFRAHYAEDIEALDKTLLKYDYSLAVAEKQMGKNAREFYEKDIYAHLEDLRKSLIITYISRQQNLPIELVQWNDAMAEDVPLANICAFVDDNAEEMVEKGLQKDFLKANAIK